MLFRAVRHPASVEFPHVDGVSHRFVDAAGLRVHVAEAGPQDAEPLILVHGWPQHWYEWRHLVPLLSDRYRMVMPDLRGLGWTQVTDRGYRKEELAGDLIALLDSLELERVKLVGHDWGGYAGFLMCLFAPERVDRFLALNMIHPWPSVNARALLAAWRLSYQLPLTLPLVGPRVTRAGYARLVLGRGGRSCFSPEEIDAFDAPLREPDRARATARYYRAFQAHDLPLIMRGHWRRYRLTVPTLLLHAEGDFAVTRSNLAGYERYADDMRVEFAPPTGHFIADAQPELVARRALEFFG
jgi:pimeloyl-ACP methyl ester carboxylesterase